MVTIFRRALLSLAPLGSHRHPTPSRSSSLNTIIPDLVRLHPLSRSFSASSPSEWKGGGKKNRKTSYKLKTHQGAAKRFFVTGRGQFKRSQAGKQHLMTGLTHQHKRNLKPMVIVNRSHQSLLRKLLPYAGKRGGFRRMNEEDCVWFKSGRFQRAGSALELAIRRAKSISTTQQTQS